MVSPCKVQILLPSGKSQTHSLSPTRDVPAKCVQCNNAHQLSVFNSTKLIRYRLNQGAISFTCFTRLCTKNIDGVLESFDLDS